MTRIPSATVDQGVYFVALDSLDYSTPKTGLSAFTVYRSRNNSGATIYTTPTITEVSAANMPGVYFLLLDEDMTIDAGDDEQEMVLRITCTGMVPFVKIVDLFRPKFTAGATLATADIAIAIDAIVVETGFDYGDVLRLMSAALVGKLSGAATTTVTIRDLTDAADRIVATVDADGNRTAVTKTP